MESGVAGSYWHTLFVWLRMNSQGVMLLPGISDYRSVVRLRINK